MFGLTNTENETRSKRMQPSSWLIEVDMQQTGNAAHYLKVRAATAAVWLRAVRFLMSASVSKKKNLSWHILLLQ